MLTAKQIIRAMRFEEACANARAGLWRCHTCGVLHYERPTHVCEHEDLELHAEQQREVRTGRLMP